MRKAKKNRKKLQTLRPKRLVGEKLSQYVQQLFEQKGKEASEAAKKAILEEAERIRYEPVKEALKYLASYWTDTTRPALLSIACEAVGGSPKAADPIAAPLALICEAVDLHDDIIDQSVKKKNHLTLYGKFGKDLTLLIGDALLFKGFTMLNEAESQIPNGKMKKILHIMKTLFFELGEAETLELSFKHRLDVKPDEYLSMVRGKAADFEAYMRISAILANASEKETEVLAGYGRILGMLAILGDDNSDVFDSNELMNRVSNEALPFPILLALHNVKLRGEILSVLQKREITRKDAKRILDLLHSKGIFETTGKYMRDYIGEGKELVKDIKDGNTLRLILESTYPE
jgi:geranylgeranyl pyrophosphate synthase